MRIFSTQITKTRQFPIDTTNPTSCNATLATLLALLHEISFAVNSSATLDCLNLDGIYEL